METNYGHPHPFRSPETASPMARGDKLWSSTPFAIHRQLGSIARRDEYGRLHPLVEDSMSFE